MAHLCTRNSSVFRGSTRGRGEFLNLNSNLNSVEKGKRIGKINFEKKRIERDIYIYVYVRIQYRFEAHLSAEQVAQYGSENIN